MTPSSQELESPGNPGRFKRGRKADPVNPLAPRVAELEHEIRRLKQKLHHAETIIDVQKKLSEMLGVPNDTPRERKRREMNAAEELAEQPHGALKFGREIRTPAMQAGLTTRRLTFRDIFLATTIPLWSRIEVCVLTGARNSLSSSPVPLPAAA